MGWAWAVVAAIQGALDVAAGAVATASESADGSFPADQRGRAETVRKFGHFSAWHF
jgi:hypothetical protein